MTTVQIYTIQMTWRSSEKEQMMRRYFIEWQVRTAKERIHLINEIKKKKNENLRNMAAITEYTNTERNLDQRTRKINVNITKNKLCKSYNGNILNLSDFELIDNQIEFLNLGQNCYLQSRFDQQNSKKKTEIEIFY